MRKPNAIAAAVVAASFLMSTSGPPCTDQK